MTRQGAGTPFAPHRVDVFDSAIEAWQAFRAEDDEGRTLVSIGVELRRTVAAKHSDGVLQLPLPDSYRLDGPAVDQATLRWMTYLAEDAVA